MDEGGEEGLKKKLSRLYISMDFKRPINGYVEFCNKVRKELKAQGSKLTPDEIMVECGRRWKLLNGSPKREHKARAKKNMGAYQQEKEARKGGMRGWQAFSKANYFVVANELGKKVGHTAVMKELGKRWKARKSSGQVGGGKLIFDM
jgi:HMG (high mobility group) box